MVKKRVRAARAMVTRMVGDEEGNGKETREQWRPRTVSSVQCRATSGRQWRQRRRKEKEQQQQSQVIMCFVLINYHYANSQK